MHCIALHLGKESNERPLSIWRRNRRSVRWSVQAWAVRNGPTEGLNYEILPVCGVAGIFSNLKDVGT